MQSSKAVSSVCGSHKSDTCQRCKDHANQLYSSLETYQGTHTKHEGTKLTTEPSTPKKGGRPKRGTAPPEVEAKEE
ncbi:hypothetical protein HMI55_003819 [Coelomomyces lativittatus]|nr:hypothetical protein HMI55_003819 [Coelomomyces lativittatus]